MVLKKADDAMMRLSRYSKKPCKGASTSLRWLKKWMSIHRALSKLHSYLYINEIFNPFLPVPVTRSPQLSDDVDIKNNGEKVTQKVYSKG